ncbi:uncharacterized protein LY89DRAFT_677464 [Mollisia scopiformis]|uniref:Uncharacterized protein n=1 Tax=Mollisia scopiformis TaxID=149040 RepID=A0A132B7L8_MOLSC|nr:uncharacterized protein LY89DRAFT_677464 [Mollisia scopiformis]KUJ07677.1 hypothetical protein LY89DRAFT_677464 [Mollisia scopiformis]
MFSIPISFPRTSRQLQSEIEKVSMIEHCATCCGERIRTVFKKEKVIDEEGSEWLVEELNERFRLCRHLPGGRFSPHFDGKHFASVNGHDGKELMAGEKYLSRTDLIHKRVVDFDFEELYGGLSEEEKGRKMLGIAERLEDNMQSEEAVKWYKEAFWMWPDLERS